MTPELSEKIRIIKKSGNREDFISLLEVLKSEIADIRNEIGNGLGSIEIRQATCVIIDDFLLNRLKDSSPTDKFQTGDDNFT